MRLFLKIMFFGKRKRNVSFDAATGEFSVKLAIGDPVKAYRKGNNWYRDEQHLLFITGPDFLVKFLNTNFNRFVLTIN